MRRLLTTAIALSTLGALPAIANEALIDSNDKVTMTLDLNSYRKLSTGIVIYTIKRKIKDPFDGTIFETKNSDWGIDCQSKENVNMRTGIRSPLTGNKSVPEKYRRGTISEEYKSAQVVTAYPQYSRTKISASLNTSQEDLDSPKRST